MWFCGKEATETESEGLGGKREREDILELFKWFGRRHSDWGGVQWNQGKEKTDYM